MPGTSDGANNDISKSEGMISAATDEKRLVQIGTLLKWYISKARTIASSIMDVFENGPLNIILLNSTYAPLSFARYQ